MTSDLPIAVRVYPDLPSSQSDRKTMPQIDGMLVFDCETRTDKAQALTFGSYRFLVEGRCLEEGLFYGDDLLPREKAILEHYVASHAADTDLRGIPERSIPSNPRLMLLSAAEFRRLLFRVTYKGRGLLVAFNSPFDISRLALDYQPSQGRFLGGFSFVLFQYRDRNGMLRPSAYRPAITVKHMDGKRSFKRFTATIDRDKEDKIPEGAASPKPDDRYIFRGHMLDAKTLAFALTDQSMSLERACELFGVEHGKQKVKRHGIVTSKYIDYNRRDVLATYELTEKLLAEYALHPIPLQATKAYSAASIGKAYLEAMGVTPLLARMPDFPKRYLGYAESAFFGGRASAHVRKVPVPIVYTDFMSQYSTVNVLMGLWNFVTASEVRIIENAREELAALLQAVTPEWVLDQANWKRLAGFARIIPDGDVLPLRAKYGGNDWQIGVNYVHASGENPDDALWYSWPDLVASVLLTGKQPRIVEAFKIEPVGKAEGLKPIVFRGQVPIDPRYQDFFKVVIEERNRLAARTDLDKSERDRLKRSLKTFGSATSYGIFAQMDRKESNKSVKLTCYGFDSEPYECTVKHPESPGEFCFPPLASLITGGSHLLLALLERLVTDRGGTYAMEDTDSMAIVASKEGGLVACPGGPYRIEDGREAIRALTWAQVDELVALLDRLNPYDREAVKEPILKIESDNRDPKPKSSVSSGAWRFPPSGTCSSCAIATASRNCYERASTTANTAGRSTASGICSIPAIPRARIAAGSRRRGSASYADRWGSQRSRCRSPIAWPWARSRSAAPRCCDLWRSSTQASRIRDRSSHSTSSSAATSRPTGIRPTPIRRAFTSLHRTKPIRANGCSCRGSISIREGSTGSARRSPRERGRSRGSRATATCWKSTSSTKKQSVQMPAARRAISRPWDCCSVGT